MSGMTLETLENAFMAWVKSKTPTGWIAVFADQNAPKINPQQVTIRRGTPLIRKVGKDLRGKMHATNGTRKVLGTRELAYEFRAYGPGSVQVAEDIRALLDDEATDATLLAAKLAVIDTTPVNDIGSLYSSQFKEVALFEIRFRTHSLREGADAEAGLGYIQAVDLDVTTVDPAGEETSEELEVGPVE